MKIKYDAESDKFVAHSKYEEKEILKKAGFRWDPAFRHWWTKDPLVARKLRQYFDDTALSAIEAAEASLEASRATDAEIDIPLPEGLSLYPYQRAGVAYVSNLWKRGKSAALIADEMGLGKTIQAIAIINLYKDIKNILIICPNTVKSVWARELERWLVRPLSVEVAGKNGFPETTNIVIMNYDILKKYAQEIRSRQWNLVIFDESHYLKNPKAQRTQYALGKWDRDEAKRISPIPAEKILFLTGTPILNRPVELWPLLHFADKEGLGKNWKYFVTRYCNGYQSRWGWDVSGASNLSELQDKLRANLMVRRLKKDVLTELPPKVRQVIEMPSNGVSTSVKREKEIFRKWEEELIRLKALVEIAKADGEEAYKEAIANLRKGWMMAFDDISSARHETALAKVPLATEYILDCLENDKKLVVFAHHHDVISALSEGLGEIPHVILVGETKQKDREKAIKNFQENPDIRVFIGSIQAAGLGITLTASSHVIFVELDWVPANMIQAEDRCHRIGQRDSVLVQHLVLEDSLDARMAKTLVGKQEIMDKALDREPEKVEEPLLPIDPPATQELTPKQVEEEKIPKKAIPLIHEGLISIAGVCDGAAKLDGMGFSKVDVEIGHSLAGMPQLTPRQAVIGLRLCRKYRRQIPSIWKKIEAMI